jgi:hypothetical protein
MLQNKQIGITSAEQILKSSLEKTGFENRSLVNPAYTSGVPDEDCWSTVEWFAGRGVLVTPGIFYGEKAKNYARNRLNCN